MSHDLVNKEKMPCTFRKKIIKKLRDDISYCKNLEFPITIEKEKEYEIKAQTLEYVLVWCLQNTKA